MAFAFYKSNRDLVVGGAGRFLWQETEAEHGSAVAFPSKIADIINVVNYAPNGANGWRDWGQTTDGVTISRGMSMTTWDTDQVPEVHEAVDRFTHTLATNIAEITAENLKLAWEGGSIVSVSGGLPGERYVPFGIPTDLTERRLAVVFKDRHGYFWAWVFREATLNTLGDAVYARGAMWVTPCTFKLFADPSINDEHDQVFRIYTDRPATTSTSTSTSTTTSTSTSTTSTSTSTTL